MLDKKQYGAVLRLLTIFARHLSLMSNQLMVAAEKAESPLVTQAKLYITRHQHEELSLHKVAGAVNTSAFYFCKVFKRATGLTFTD